MPGPPDYSALYDACRQYVDMYMSDYEDNLPAAADDIQHALHGHDPYATGGEGERWARMSPGDVHPPRRARWAVVDLARTLPGVCGGKLTLWAMGLRRVWQIRRDDGCRDDAARCGRCVCGALVSPPGQAR